MPMPLPLHQLTHLLDRASWGGVEHGTTFSFQRRHLLHADTGEAHTPAAHVDAGHSGEASRPTTAARRVARAHLLQARQPHPLAPQHTLDAGGRTGPFLLQGFQVPVQMALILGLDRGGNTASSMHFRRRHPATRLRPLARGDSCGPSTQRQRATAGGARQSAAWTCCVGWGEGRKPQPGLG